MSSPGAISFFAPLAFVRRPSTKDAPLGPTKFAPWGPADTGRGSAQCCSACISTWCRSAVESGLGKARVWCPARATSTPALGRAPPWMTRSTSRPGPSSCGPLEHLSTFAFGENERARGGRRAWACAPPGSPIYVGGGCTGATDVGEAIGCETPRIQFKSRGRCLRFFR